MLMSMARRWTLEEEETYRRELVRLYITENRTIRQVGEILGIAESSVFQRLKRLGISTVPYAKKGYLNCKQVQLPEQRTSDLAEFFGIMLGDGHISHFQAMVTLGTKELAYVEYVARLIEMLFGGPATVSIRKDGYRDVYVGSVRLTSWLRDQGLVSNKVASQVDAPPWIFSKSEYMNSFLRGFFDTDGSVYRLRFGIQISLTNRSRPLLHSLQGMLSRLGYKPSAVSACRVYLTRKDDVSRFFNEVRPANHKHLQRYVHIMNS